MLRAHKTRIRNANPGSSIARALAQHDGATRWAYNALLARLNDATLASPAGALWPSVDDLAKTLRCEKPEWWATVDWEMLDNGRIRLATALQRWSQCRKGKPEWHQSGSCGFPRFHRRGNRKSVSFSSHVGDGRRVQWHDQWHITLPSIRQPTVVQAWRAEAAAHQQGHRAQHQTEPQQTHQSTWAALRATGTVAIPTGESTADAPAADCIRDSEVCRYGGSGNAERGRDSTQPTPGQSPDGRSSRRVPAGTGMAMREAWGAAAQSGEVVPQHTDLREVWRSHDERIGLSERVYRCHLCGWQCDRDQNAALNLKEVAPALWATIKGGGGDVSPAPGLATASEASIGQGDHWQPRCFLVDGEIMAGYSDYAKSQQSVILG